MTTTATSKTSGKLFNFKYDIFTIGRETMHSCEIEVGGVWRSADVMVIGSELHGFADWLENGQRNDIKFVVTENEDTRRMVAYSQKDAAEYAAEKAAKRQAAINQETYLG